jgi:hypothetical protein
MALIISSFPNEILVFSLRLLINDKQQQIHNTPAWWLPALTSTAFKPVLGVLKAWYEIAQPSSWADAVLDNNRLHKFIQVFTPQNAALIGSLTLRLAKHSPLVNMSGMNENARNY